MKFTIQTILSLPIDGASSHLLIFNNSVKIMLNCGISHSFNFEKYLDKAEQLKTVSLVLISHSQLEYSGAIAFLIDEIGMDPKIFYTTQSIVRYSPLNLHESLLSLRSKAYSKKIFNRIYKIYQSINIIKPQQKKSLNVDASETLNPSQPSQTHISTMQAQQQKPAIGEVQKIIYFTCFSAGSNMGSLTWRLSYGIVNILYLVEYNNYSLYHINGLELPQIMQPTDILITDTYKNIDDSWMKKNQLYLKIKNLLMNFYERNGIPFARPPVMANVQAEKKLLITCYPNESLVQVMAVMNKILQDTQPPESRQKIRVVHLSSRFLQLIKSQMDYFSTYFKDTLQNIEQFFVHSKTISGRINLATLESLQSLLYDSVDKTVEIYHIGQQINVQKMERARREGEQNIMKFKIMTIQQKLGHSSSKINIDEEQAKEELAQKGESSQMSQQKELTISEVPDEIQAMKQQVQVKINQPLHGKFLSRIGFFPRFASRQTQQEHIFDDYGARHEYERFEQRKTIESYRKQIELGVGDRPQIQKKQSSIEVMNIQFKIPQTDRANVIDYSKISYIPFYSCRTNFNSSIQIIMTMKPDNVILINTDSNPRISLSDKYQETLAKAHLNDNSKKINIFDLALKKGICHLFIQNELISYKVNYIPIPQERRLQKVKGLISYSEKGVLYLHLDCLQQKQLLEFRLDKFYKKVKSLDLHTCVFTKTGIVIDGVKIYREEKKIILEGQYSEQYFKVRKLLYDFLQME